MSMCEAAPAEGPSNYVFWTQADLDDLVEQVYSDPLATAEHIRLMDRAVEEQVVPLSILSERVRAWAEARTACWAWS